MDRSRFLLDPRKPLDSRWIDRASFWLFVDFSLDRSSTASPVNAFLLDTSQHLYLSRLTGLLFKRESQFPTHFSLSLSRQTCLFTSQNSLSLTPNVIPKCSSSFFKFFSSLGKFLFSHLHAFHVLKPRFWGFSKLMSFC